MCLAVPGRLLETYDERDLRMGKVGFGGVVRRVCLEYLPDAAPGDYVLVHVGFALSVIDEAEAQRMLATLEQLGELDQGEPS